MRNLLTRVPKSAQALVGTLIRTIFAQPDAEQTSAQHARVVEQLTEKFADAAAMLADAETDVLAFSTSRRSTGARSGPTTPRSASTGSCAGAPTSWASSPTETPWSAWSAPCWPNNTTSGP